MSDHPYEPVDRVVVTARHASRCPLCDTTIAPGEEIVNVDGEWLHAEPCAEGGGVSGQGDLAQDRGTAPRRRARTGTIRTVEAPYRASHPERWTPPCACGLPLVKSDKRCPRCGASVPWGAEA